MEGGGLMLKPPLGGAQRPESRGHPRLKPPLGGAQRPPAEGPPPPLDRRWAERPASWQLLSPPDPQTPSIGVGRGAMTQHRGVGS